MRSRSALFLLILLGAAPLAAQEDLPTDLVSLELARSRTCIDVLSRLETLDLELAPLANRAQRLLAIANAINIEETSVVDSLNVADSVEAAVRDWFEADATLAQRYLDEQSQAVLDERAAGKRAIQETVRQALEEVQAQADSVVAPTGTLTDDGAACSGVILVRPEAIEACVGVTSRVCDAARDTSAQAPFRFVDDAEMLWYEQELRPWSAPGPLGVSPQGQLTGARSLAGTRVGNIVITTSLGPLLRPRADLSPDELAVFDSINSPLGIESTHPDLIFAPALTIQASLTEPIGGESRYILHFGSPDQPDVLWMTEATANAALAGTVALAPAHIARLADGHPLFLSAIRDSETQGDFEVVYAIELSTVNQANPVRTLLAYMAQQLSADLQRLVPPENP